MKIFEILTNVAAKNLRLKIFLKILRKFSKFFKKFENFLAAKSLS